MKNTRGISTMSMLMFMVLMTLQHNLDFTDANSIPWQEAQNVALDYITFTNQSEFKNCSTNSDCSADLGQTCVSGTCSCNRFGWRYEPYEWYDRCNHITCALHAECRSHFGQGSFCNADHYCSCATEIDPITQQCADPFLQINAKCAEDSTCEWNFGTESYCKWKIICECNGNHRFSPSQRKCVPMEENIWANDWQLFDDVQFYFSVAIWTLTLILACVIIGAVVWDKVKSLRQKIQNSKDLKDNGLNSTKPKQSLNEPPPDYFEADFSSTKFERMSPNFEQQQDENYCNHQNAPTEYSPPLYDSLADPKPSQMN